MAAGVEVGEKVVVQHLRLADKAMGKKFLSDKEGGTVNGLAEIGVLRGLGPKTC